MREPAWRKTGSTPDYRFSLANETTFLAWIRTALAVLAAGAVVVMLLVGTLARRGEDRHRPDRRRTGAARHRHRVQRACRAGREQVALLHAHTIAAAAADRRC